MSPRSLSPTGSRHSRRTDATPVRVAAVAHRAGLQRGVQGVMHEAG
jgi:hypothetical protein